MDENGPHSLIWNWVIVVNVIVFLKFWYMLIICVGRCV